MSGFCAANRSDPRLPASRCDTFYFASFKPVALVKRVEWQRTWELQPREDAAEDLDVPVPPKHGGGSERSAVETRPGSACTGRLGA